MWLKVFVETVSQSLGLIICKGQCTLRLIIANEVNVDLVFWIVLIVGDGDGAHGLNLDR